MGRTRWRLLAAAGALLLLTGCVPEDEPAPTPTESAPEPTFSDEELLAMASETYSNYIEELESMVHEQDFDYTRLLPYASPEIATQDVATMQEYADRGWVQSGERVITNLVLRDDDTSDRTRIFASACMDTSSISFSDSDGNDVTPGEIPDEVALDLQFASTANDSALQLVLMDGWSGNGPDPCL